METIGVLEEFHDSLDLQSAWRNKREREEQWSRRYWSIGSEEHEYQDIWSNGIRISIDVVLQHEQGGCEENNG